MVLLFSLSIGLFDVQIVSQNVHVYVLRKVCVYNLQAGRSSYVRPEEVAKTPDPGAMAAAQWLRAAAQSLSTWKCNCKDPCHVINALGWVLLEGPILQLWDEQLTQFVSVVHQAFEATTHYVQNNIHDRVLEKRWFRLSPFLKTHEDSHTQQLLPCNCIFWHLCNNNLLKSFSYFTHLGLPPKLVALLREVT